MLAIINLDINFNLVKENRMKVTVNQRCVLLVILAMILIMALLKGMPQSTEVEHTGAKNPFLSTMHFNAKTLELEKYPKDSELGKPVRINSATAEEIANHLEGIGETIAQRIVAKRQKQGPFQNFEQLESVSGVGVAKIEANRERISFE